MKSVHVQHGRLIEESNLETASLENINKDFNAISVNFKQVVFNEATFYGLSEEGTLYFWGKSPFSTDENSQITKPLEVPYFIGRRVLSIACGSNHCIALVCATKNRFVVSRNKSDSFLSTAIEIPVPVSRNSIGSESLNNFLPRSASEELLGNSIEDDVHLAVGQLTLNLPPSPAHQRKQTVENGEPSLQYIELQERKTSTLTNRFSFVLADEEAFKIFDESEESNDTQSFGSSASAIFSTSLHGKCSVSYDWDIDCSSLDTEVWTWGANGYGQLGSGDQKSRYFLFYYAQHFFS